MSEADRTYIPAAGHDWLLPLYDPLTKLMGSASAHRRLIDQANLQPGDRVLEIGCGTGNLTMLAKTLHPAVDIVGLDPDPTALARARRKAERQSAPIQLDRGFSGQLHYLDESFDRVLSALMFHHLTRDEKAQTVHEIRRVLKPGGSLHLVDFGGAHDGRGGILAHLRPRTQHVRDNSPEMILGVMREAGLDDARQVGHRRTIFGRLLYYRAGKARTM
jgi:ubiquinone/menaquinone biosynthesis C-methylase UbiE